MNYMPRSIAKKPGGRPPLGRRTRRAAVLALLSVTALLLAACGSGSASSSGGSSGGPKQGGTLTVALDGNPDGLDPGFVATHVAEEVTNQMYAELVSQSPSGTYVPWLATSWSSNANASVWTLNLRHGVKFQDGAPFNAAAVCFNLDRAVSPALGSHGAGIILAPLKSCTEDGNYKVTVTFSQGYEPFLNVLSTPLLGMVSPAAVKAEGKNFNLTPVDGGSGPFEFVKWVQNSQIQLKRWPGYKWPPAGSTHTGEAYLSGITFDIVPETSVRMGAITSDQYDAAESMLPSTYTSMKQNTALRTYVVNEAAASYQLSFNTAKAPWNTLQMREAVRDAIDIPSMLQSIYFGTEHQAWSTLAPNVQFYDSSLDNSWKFDPSESKKLLQQLGWTAGPGGYLQKQGQTLTLSLIDISPDTNSDQECDTVLQQQLKAVGIKVTITDFTQTQEQDEVAQGNYSLVGITLGLSSPNVLNFLYNSAFVPTTKSFGFDWSQVKNTQMDTLLAQGEATTSNSSLTSIYRSIQQLIATNVWSIPLYVPTYTFVTQSSVHGVTFEYAGYPNFYATWMS
jgi:peptide/nickel transport system substrate-binding protein